MKKTIISLLIMLSISLSACSIQPGTAVKTISSAPIIEEIKELPVSQATLIAVGDIMFHLPQITEARTEDGYDFGLSFEKIKPYISGADLAIGNFETTVNEERALSGYPRFNSPAEVVEGLSNTGFDVMITANNHCMDTGVEGAENTAALIKQNKMVPIGVGQDNKKAIIEINGIRIGILAYTSSINGLRAPEGFVNIAKEENIKADIESIKDKCDFLVAYMHAGVEYNRDVEEETVRLFRAVADMGADCVLGSHPHVARKSELYQTGHRKVLINYSMGNFLSNQNDKYTDIGTMTKLIINKQGDTAKLGDFEIIPTYRLRYVDTDGRTKRRIILSSEIDSYNHISEVDKLYIRKVRDELTRLIKEERTGALDIK